MPPNIGIQPTASLAALAWRRLMLAPFKKFIETPEVAREIKERSKLSQDEENEYFYGHGNFPGEKQDSHLAMFPEEFSRRLIRMFSFVGEPVFDPFLGRGATTLAAKNLHRKSIGYEISESFLPFIKEKIGIEGPNIFDK